MDKNKFNKMLRDPEQLKELAKALASPLRGPSNK